MKKSFVPLSVLKQKARQLKKSNSSKEYKLHNSRDDAAVFFGFSNFKNYLNEAEANRKNIERNKVEGLQELASQKNEERNKRIQLVESRIKNINLSLKEMLKDLRSKPNSKRTVQLFCENSTELKSFIELNLLKEFLEDKDGDIEDFAPDHLAKIISIRNPKFKLGKGKLKVEADYDISLDFAFDTDESDKSGHFDDQEMFGSFEIKIEEDKKITFLNFELGWNY